MGTYNYSARELADEIGELLNNLEGDFTPAELEKALGLVAVEHGVQRTCANCGANNWVSISNPNREYCGNCGASR